MCYYKIFQRKLGSKVGIWNGHNLDDCFRRYHGHGRIQRRYGVRNPLPWKITFYRFLYKLTFGTHWIKLDPPGKCWTPSGTLENYSFPSNKPLDPLCKTVKLKQQKKKEKIQSFFCQVSLEPPPPPPTNSGSAHDGARPSLCTTRVDASWMHPLVGLSDKPAFFLSSYSFLIFFHAYMYFEMSFAIRMS